MIVTFFHIHILAWTDLVMHITVKDQHTCSERKNASSAHRPIDSLVYAGSKRAHTRNYNTNNALSERMYPPKFHKFLYKLLTTQCVVSDCAPLIKKSFLRPWIVLPMPVCETDKSCLHYG